MQRPLDTEASPLPHLSLEEWRAWRESHPPIAGADDGTVPSGSAPEAASTEDPTTAPAESGTSDPTPAEPAFETPFNINEVDEAYREHVERYNRQLQGAYTRKTQELAQQRSSLADTIALHEALANDDTRDEAIRNLLSQHGWEVGDDDPDPDPAPAHAADPAGDPAPPSADDDVRARLAAIEADRQAEREAAEQRARDEYASAVADAVNEGIEAYRTAEKLEKVSEETRTAIVAIARSLQPLDGGMPDMESAIAIHQANLAADRQRYIASKDVPTPELSGVAGKAAFNPRNDAERLAKANAVAARHL